MTTTQPEGRSGVAWDELVGAALVGTERRTPPGVPPGQDPAAALLDAAAADTV
ncbi:hypothetical protein GCU69_05995, partial [Streptomyces lycii]